MVEFNDGFITALALCYAHRMASCQTPSGKDYRLSGAADHLVEMDLPEDLPDELKKSILRLRKKIIEKRLELMNPEDVDKMFDELVEIFKRLDKHLFGLDVTVTYP